MKYGFDIDDTLINLREYAFHYYNEQLQQQQSLEAFLQLPRLEIHELFGLTSEEGTAMWQRSAEQLLFTDCPIFDGALDVLHRLQAEGHELYYITARNSCHTTPTFEWMEKQGFPIKQQNFYCGMRDDEKVHIIQDLKLDVYTDDKPAILHTLTNSGTTALLKHHSYNQHAPFLRFTHWHEWFELAHKSESSD